MRRGGSVESAMLGSRRGHRLGAGGDGELAGAARRLEGMKTAAHCARRRFLPRDPTREQWTHSTQDMDA